MRTPLQTGAQRCVAGGDVRFRLLEDRGFSSLRLASNDFSLAVRVHFRLGYAGIEAFSEGIRSRAVRIGCLDRTVGLGVTLIQNGNERTEKEPVQNQQQGEETTELKDKRPIWREIQHKYVSASWRKGSPSRCGGDPEAVPRCCRLS